MQGTPKAIEIKGIVRNATVIGAQDGQAEDLINLRFMDGSWRASGDGRLINFTMGAEYMQLYVHTNIYRNLIGVNSGKLWWFATIDADGVTFNPLGTPVELTSVTGDIWITQTGHLLTIIDEADNFEYFVYRVNEGTYKHVDVSQNGEMTDRGIYPFGQVHFNLYSPIDEEHTHRIDNGGETTSNTPASVAQSFMIQMFNEATEKNQFTNPFLALVALKTYDGTYVFSSNPVLIVPREVSSVGGGYHEVHEITDVSPSEVTHTITSEQQQADTPSGYYDSYVPNVPIAYQNTDFSVDQELSWGSDWEDTEIASTRKLLEWKLARVRMKSINDESIEYIPHASAPVYVNGGGYLEQGDPSSSSIGAVLGLNSRYVCIVYGSDLCLSIDEENAKFLEKNSDVFQALSIFITNPADLYDMSAEGYKNAPFYKDFKKTDGDAGLHASKASYRVTHGGGSVLLHSYGYTYIPKKYDKDHIIGALMKSPFYLLREYNKDDIHELLTNPVVNMSGQQYDGVLKNIVQQQRLQIEASSRVSYLPKCVYSYNGRLHIANYKTHQYHGYPLEMFHLHNHSVAYEAGSYFKGVLHNLKGNNENYLHFTNTDYTFPDSTEGLSYFAFVRVIIETDDGNQRAVRYIAPYDISPAVNGRADFIETLNPLITFPDFRAKYMYIVICKPNSANAPKFYTKSLTLKPHALYNFAYYIDENLKPIAMGAGSVKPGEGASWRPELPSEENMLEFFPNGLKASSPENPIYFPVENTYQVGSAEILALMSNTIAVGTGQTGAAPLYVFCKDGVYALFVDASGQMTYSNSRVLARDVCNNPRSVTPIDAGVVFTTDRGLMMIAGEQVEEIGQPAEGDVLHYTNVNAQGQPLSVEGSKIASDALTKIAGLPSSLCDTTDFLTYLQDKGTLGKAAIVNYNHNMRELIISNPNYPYSYVLDREGNWSRRDYTAAEYVNNYPTSYRVTSDGKFYKLDDEGDASTSLEHRKEADNQIFYLSNVIKLDSIGFKQAYRFVVRGYFETMFAGQDMITDTIYDRKIIVTGLSIDNMGIGEVLRMAYLHIYGMDAWVSVGEQGEVGNILTLEIYDALTLENITKTFRPTGMPGEYITLIKTETTERPAMACVVEGSYDGIKFAPLGFNRKTGKFTNIGCHVSHTDVRFYRVILCGQVTGKTRIDYMELSADGSKLNTKIR